MDLGGFLGGSSASGLPADEIAAQTALLFGSDIWYDLSSTSADGFASYIVTPAGDLKQATGREALRQALLRRLLTNPGDWKTNQTFGVGARLYVKARNTPAARAQLEAAIRAQFLQDKRVASVDLVIVTPLADGSDGIQISIITTPVGTLSGTGPISVAAEVH